MSWGNTFSRRFSPKPTSNSPELQRGSLSTPKAPSSPPSSPSGGVGGAEPSASDRVGLGCRALGMTALCSCHVYPRTTTGCWWRPHRVDPAGELGAALWVMGGGLRHPRLPPPHLPAPGHRPHRRAVHLPCPAPAPQSLFISPNPHGASCDPRGSRLMVAEPFPFPARRHPGSGRGE